MDAFRDTRNPPAGTRSAAPDSALHPAQGSASHWRRFRLLGSLLLLGILGAAAHFEWLALKIDHTVSRMQSVREAMEENRKLLGYAVDLESGHRGYLLTGDRRQLESHAAADHALPEQIATLEKLLQQDPALIAILSGMKEMLLTKREEMAQAQQSFENGRLGILESYARDLGKYEMDSLRTGAQTIESALEQAALHERRAISELVDRQTLAMRVTLVFFALIGAAAMFFGGRHFDTLRRQERLVEELVRTQKRNDEKTTFLAHVSHEIRTPMNAIFGFSSLLHDRLHDPVNRRYIDAITSSARALLNIINDLLDLSAVEAGKISIARRAGDLREVLDGVQSLFSEQAAAKSLSLRVEVDANVPGAVMMDGDRVRQMLVNLVGNAVKYTDRGHVHVHAHAHPGTEPRTATCVIEVDDSGRGVAPDDTERIFEPFSRCGPEAGGPDGTGLGLSISRQLARAMNGDITVRSRLGYGSCFTLTLPNLVLAGAASVHPSTALRLSDLPRFSALAIDDIDMNREVLEALFLETPHELRTAGSGNEALAMLRGWQPDVVLLDIRMAGIDGIEVARRMRADPCLRGIRRVALTASKLKDHPADAALFDGVLLKPISEYALARELAHVLGSELRIAPLLSAPDAVPMAPDPALILELRALLESGWRTARSTPTIREVQDFAQLIESLGQKYAAPGTRRYGLNLMNAASGFDVAGMEVLLADFPALVAELEATMPRTVDDAG